MIQATDVNTLFSTTTAYATTLFTGVLGNPIVWVLGISILLAVIAWVMSPFRRRRF